VQTCPGLPGMLVTAARPAISGLGALNTQVGAPAVLTDFGRRAEREPAGEILIRE
jgi:hypothetical protein